MQIYEQWENTDMKRLLSVWPCDVSVISSHTHTHTLCVRRSALSHWDVLFQGSLFFGGGMFAAVLLFWPTSCQRRSSTPHRQNFSFQTDTNGMSLDSRTFLSRTWLCVCVCLMWFLQCVVCWVRVLHPQVLTTCSAAVGNFTITVGLNRKQTGSCCCWR